MLMAGFELGSSGIRSDCSADCATAPYEANWSVYYYLFLAVKKFMSPVLKISRAHH